MHNHTVSVILSSKMGTWCSSDYSDWWNRFKVQSFAALRTMPFCFRRAISTQKSSKFKTTKFAGQRRSAIGEENNHFGSVRNWWYRPKTRYGTFNSKGKEPAYLARNVVKQVLPCQQIFEGYDWRRGYEECI